MSIKLMSLAWAITGLTPLEKLVLLKLSDHSNDEGHSWPGRDHLSTACSCSIRGVVNSISKLESLGLLEKIKRTNDNGFQRSNLYILKIEEYVSNNKENIGVQSVHPLCTQTENTGVHSVHPRGALSDTLGVHSVHPETSIETSIETTKEKPVDKKDNQQEDNSSNAGLNSDCIFPDKQKTPPNKFSENYAPISVREWQEYFSAKKHQLSFDERFIFRQPCMHMFASWVDKQMTLGFVRKIVDEKIAVTPKINSPLFFQHCVMNAYEEKLKTRPAKPSAQIQHKPAQAFLQPSLQRVKPEAEVLAKNIQSLKSALQPPSNKVEAMSA